ncbi:hypothetical protein MTO96_008887 [Rhipicephalus appendiculatus]
MAEDKSLAVGGSVDYGDILKVVSVVAGVLVICAVLKLVLGIVSYAEASVKHAGQVLAGGANQGGEGTVREDLRASLWSLGSQGPLRWRRLREAQAKKRVLAKDSAKADVFARPVQKDDDSSDDVPDEEALSDNGQSLLDGLSNLVKVVLDAFAENLQDSHPPLDTRPTSLLFGELLGACDQLSATTFADVLDHTNARDIVKTNEGAHWDVFRVTTPGGAAVLKVLHVEYIARYAKQLCNHLLVSRALERLSDERGSNFTTGFVLVTRALCVWDGYPRELSDACRRFAEARRDIASRNVDHMIDYRQVPQPYLVLQTDYAGIPLSSVETLSAAQVVSVFRQVILSLAVAETAFNFEHRHLSLDSIYLTRTQRESIEWRVDGRRYRVLTRGVVAHVTDFSAARADIDDETQFSDPRPVWEDCKTDRVLKGYSQDYP